MQWPVTEDAPKGTPRLYADGVFPTDPAYCEDYGHDLNSGGTHTREEYEASVELDPQRLEDVRLAVAIVADNRHPLARHGERHALEVAKVSQRYRLESNRR